MRKTFGLFFLVFGLLLTPTLAHQPTLVTSDLPINDPEVSRAFYDELSGQARIYRIHSANDFNLYINLLVPSSNPAGRYSAIIYKGDKPIARLQGENYSWTAYYEKFAGDNYFKGPEYRNRAAAGDYQIVVFGNNNRGKYVLAVGEKEEWPLAETARALILLPTLKKDFFGTPVWPLLFTPMGIFYWAAPAILLLAAFTVWWLSRKKRHG